MGRDRAQGTRNIVAVSGRETQQIGGQIDLMDAHQSVPIGIDLPLHQRDMLAAIDLVAIDVNREIPSVEAVEGCGLHPFHELLGLATIGDQVGDGSHLEAVLRGELQEFGKPCHRAVVVHHLADHAGGLEPGDARDIDRRLGMASANEDAAVPRDEGKDVAWGHDIEGALGGIDGDGDGMRAILRRNSRGDALARLDRYREGGAMPGLVVERHRGELQMLRTGPGDREADEPSGIFRHEVDGARRCELGRDDDVALILAIVGIDEDVRLAVDRVLDDLLDRRERCRQRSPGSGDMVHGLGFLREYVSQHARFPRSVVLPSAGVWASAPCRCRSWGEPRPR